MEKDIKEIKQTVQTLHDKLFVGNGQPPITVQLDRLNCFKKFSYWVYGVMFVGAVGFIVRLVCVAITT